MALNETDIKTLEEKNREIVNRVIKEEKDKLRTIFNEEDGHTLFEKNDVMNVFMYFDNIFSEFDIYTTRYSIQTYFENIRFKESIGFDGSLYSSMLRLPANTPDGKYLFMLDMNNDINKIMGIGIIRNNLAKDQTINVYDNPSFNNYIYKSSFYIPLIDTSCIDRENTKKRRKKTKYTYYENIQESWIEFIENEFEKEIFYGKTHLKRGGSFTRFPIKKLKYRHLMFILCMFIILNPQDFNNIIACKYLEYV